MPVPPRLVSALSSPITANNFVPMQSASMAVGTANASSVTFTNIPSSQRVTYKLSNVGTKAAFISATRSTNPVAAIVATSSPQPTSTLLSISTCDCLPAGAILTQDYPGGTDMISAICGGTDTTTLQISIGGGQ